MADGVLPCVAAKEWPSGLSGAPWLKKRGEGCKHVQAVIALARRRAGVLWALLRDDRVFTPAPPVAQAA